MALGNWPKGIVEDAYDYMMEEYDLQKSRVDDLFEIKTPSEGAYDQKTTFIGMGTLQQQTSEDVSVTFRRPSEGFTAYCVYRQFDDGLQLTWREVQAFPKNKLRDLVMDAAKTWGNKAKLTEDNFGATLFTKGGFTGGHANFGNVIPGVLSQNTDNLAYDAKPAFNRSGNTRTSKGSGTYYNAISSAPLNVTNYATLHDLIFVTNSYDERDERIDLEAMGPKVLLIPPQLRDEATRTLESEYLPGGSAAVNDKNPWFSNSKIMVWGALNANAATWYLGIAKQGISFYRVGKPELRFYRDEDNGRYKATIRTLYGWMFWNFRPWGGADVPTS